MPNTTHLADSAQSTVSSPPSSHSQQTTVTKNPIAEALIDYVASLHTLWGLEPDSSRENALEHIAALASNKNMTTGSSSVDRISSDGFEKFLQLAFHADFYAPTGKPLIPTNISYHFMVFLDDEGNPHSWPCAVVDDIGGSHIYIDLHNPHVVNTVLGCLQGSATNRISILCQVVCLYCDAVSFYRGCGSQFSSFVRNFAVMVSALRDTYSNYPGDTADGTDGGADDVHPLNIPCGGIR